MPTPSPTRIVLVCLLVCAWPARAEPPAAAPADPARAAPRTPDPRGKYVFYLHGRIVEQQGEDAVSPEFGRYEYRAILEAFTRAGYLVISEVRPASTAVPAYAKKVASHIRDLRAAGVPAAHIAVVGASKGGAIALQVSRSLNIAGIGYVVLGSCGADAAKSGRLHGDVLSIYEASDPVGRSCGAAFAASPALGAHRELELHTGLRHGFLYRPLPEWLEPALSWLAARR